MGASGFVQPSSPPVALLLSDLDGEDRDYWPAYWAKSRIDGRLVDLGHSGRPDRNHMVTRLDRAMRDIGTPVVLVGHGAGALAIAAWGELMSCEAENGVVGALLVAPSDPSSPDADRRLRDFGPLPSAILSFPALVLASDDDPLLSPERAFSLARQWGAGFASFGRCGHFGPEDGLGWWPEGEELLDRFIDLVDVGRDHGRRAIDPAMIAATRNAASLFRP